MRTYAEGNPHAKNPNSGYDETGEDKSLRSMERGITETENWRSNL